MALTAQWQAATCADLLKERAPIVRILLGGYCRTIGHITWAAGAPGDGAKPVITIAHSEPLDAYDLQSLRRLINAAYIAAGHVVLDEARDAWENSPEAEAAREDLDAGEPPAETCILPAAWDPTAAIALAGRAGLDDALTAAASDTAEEWVPIHPSKPWTVTWAHI